MEETKTYTSKDSISSDDRDLIDIFIKEKGVTVIPMTDLEGYDIVRKSNEAISEARKLFREKNKQRNLLKNKELFDE